MKLVRCDHHPDREAVASFRIIEMPAGAQPIFVGYQAGGTMADLCEECASAVRFTEKKASSDDS